MIPEYPRRVSSHSAAFAGEKPGCHYEENLRRQGSVLVEEENKRKER